jgi:hypothetical protein
MGGGGTGSGEIIERTTLRAETVKEEVKTFCEFEEVTR